jgi:hypothetical protein
MAGAFFLTLITLEMRISDGEIENSGDFRIEKAYTPNLFRFSVYSVTTNFGIPKLAFKVQ